jgi:hypothetical protein
VITTYKQYQVIRFFMVDCRLKKGSPANYFIIEAVQCWMNKEGKTETLSLLRGMSILSAVIQKAESPRALFKPSFSAYMEAEKSLKATDAMKAMYLHRDSTEVIGKILKCRYAIVQPHSGVQQKKTASFLLSPDMEKCIGKLKPASK